MKRRIIFSAIMVMAVFLCGTNAFLQQQPVNQGEITQKADWLAKAYISSMSRHKVIVRSEDAGVYNDLIGRNAVVNEIDYGSFKLLVVDENALGGRDALMALPVPVRDDQDLILLNGYVLDTTSPESTYEKLPVDLRQTDMITATPKGVEPKGGLYIVQFAGPVRDEWLDELKGTGAEVITYIASNAYIVRAGVRAARSLVQLKGTYPFVQFLGNYEPAYRLSPNMQSMLGAPPETMLNITVQVVAGRGAARTINGLKEIASEFIRSDRVLNYHNVQLKVPAGRLADIARIGNVFAVEERGELERTDEMQSMILSGFFTGNAPTSPGYLSFLSQVGFNSSQFGSFSVNVVDDAYSLAGHPDLPASRIAFENNPSSQTGQQPGHGFLNAHIVGGFNNSTGSAFEDAGGFNYGLGIAPWARVGVTAIFGPSLPAIGSWESTAYGQGARISTNSWGFRTIRRYDANAQAYDRLVRDAQPGTPGLQQMIMIFGAGNEGSGAGTIISPGTAKNVITVGASESVRQSGTDGCLTTNAEADSANDIVGFSSRGPVNAGGGDGRVKPDIMAPGTHIVGGVPQSNYSGATVCTPFFPPGQTLYGLSSGTSLATPAVAGGAALIYQSFINNGLGVPSPAFLKAYLMNSTTYMTGTGANDTLPSNNQGMGRLDLLRGLNGQARMFFDQHLLMGQAGDTFQISGFVHLGSRPLRITLAWTDAPGPTVGAALVNNLDLELVINGTTYRGNVFAGANSVSGGIADSRNNVESIFLPAGITGSFTVTVRATTIGGDGVPGNGDTTDQDFALLISNGRI